MKKTCIFLTCLMLLATMMPTVAIAAESYPLTASVNKTEVTQGDTVHTIAKCQALDLEHLAVSLGKPRQMSAAAVNASDDVTPPAIKSVSFNTHEAIPGESLVVTVEAEEESGIAYKQLLISCNFDKTSNWEYSLKETETKGVYTAEIPITKDTRNGTYYISAIYLTDTSGNHTSFATYDIKDDLEKMAQYQYTVTGGVSDITGPVLKSVTADKTDISEIGVVTFTAKIEDESNVRSFSLRLKYTDPDTGRVTIIEPYFTKVEGNVFDAKYYFDGTIPTGEYKAVNISMCDEYENRTYLASYEYTFVNNIVRKETVEFDGGNGTVENPYIISTKEQLNEVRYHLASSFKLAKDIIFTSEDFEENGDFYNEGVGWIPIANKAKGGISPDDVNPELENSELCFSGTFDGNECIIEGLKAKGSYVVGLFGETYHATIKNLTMKDCIIYGLNKAGGVAAGGFCSSFENCHNDSIVTSNCNAGGIVGDVYGGSITNCTSKGAISTVSEMNSNRWTYTGGIVGHAQWNLVVRDCINYASIKANAGHAAAGGIMGSHDCEGDRGTCLIEKSANYGNIESGEFAGGIAGETTSQIDKLRQVKECYNYGMISSTKFAGGIVGCNIDLNIIDCYNAGNIIGGRDYAIGGIVGHDGFVDFDIEDMGHIKNCYNVGTLSGSNILGGILGYQKNGTVENCYYLDNVKKGSGNKEKLSVAKAISSSEIKEESSFVDFDFESTWKYIKEQDSPALYWQEGSLKEDDETDTPSTPSSGGYVPTIQNPEVSLAEGSAVTFSADGTIATISVQEGYILIDVVVNGISKGAITSLSGLKTGDVVRIVTEKVLSEEEILMADLADVRLDADSVLVTLKNGKKAIKITWSGDDIIKLDGIEVFRSTQKSSGFGKKPIYISKSRAYYNTAIKTGTKYYYKVRGYVELDGVKYYTDYSTKAWRTAK